MRELVEETGYQAREWAYAGVLHNAIAYSDERIEIFFARGLIAGERQLDDEEFLDLLPVEGAAVTIPKAAGALLVVAWLATLATRREATSAGARPPLFVPLRIDSASAAIATPCGSCA